MMAGIVVRSARAADAADLAPLLAQLGYPQGAVGLDERIDRMADTGTDAVLVAVVDGRVVGLVSLHVTPFFNEGAGRGRVTSSSSTTAGVARGSAGGCWTRPRTRRGTGAAPRSS
jgi:hypothetical protein